MEEQKPKSMFGQLAAFIRTPTAPAKTGGLQPATRMSASAVRTQIKAVQIQRQSMVDVLSGVPRPVEEKEKKMTGGLTGIKAVAKFKKLALSKSNSQVHTESQDAAASKGGPLSEAVNAFQFQPFVKTGTAKGRASGFMAVAAAAAKQRETARQDAPAGAGLGLRSQDAATLPTPEGTASGQPITPKLSVAAPVSPKHSSISTPERAGQRTAISQRYGQQSAGYNSRTGAAAAATATPQVQVPGSASVTAAVTSVS